MSDGARQSRRQAGLFGFFLTVLVLVLALFLMRERPWREGGLEQPEVSDPEQSVEALVAEVRGADGSRLWARLTPLHLDPARQEFEREALRRGLDLGAGEPWRLSLEWRRSEGERPPEAPRASGSGSARFTGSGPARGEPLPAPATSLGLGDVTIEDAEGLALAPLPGPDGAGAGPEPLRALLAPPSGSLGPGQAVDWVLWGRPPGPQARLVGLLPPPGSEGAGEFTAATGLEGVLTFAPQQVPRRELLRPLARLERPGAETHGKNGAPGSSERP